MLNLKILKTKIEILTMWRLKGKQILKTKEYLKVNLLFSTLLGKI